MSLFFNSFQTSKNYIDKIKKFPEFTNLIKILTKKLLNETFDLILLTKLTIMSLKK